MAHWDHYESSHTTMAHPLWQGSAMDTARRMKSLTYTMAQDHIARKERCDDLTGAERSFVDCLKADIKARDDAWEF